MLSNAQPKPPSRFSEKLERKKRDYAEALAITKQVDARDRRQCRVCGRRCSVTAVALLDRAHRHHIIYRSAGGPDTSWNLVTLCAGCHDAQHAGLLDVRGNADEGLEIWRNGADGWYLSAREIAPHVTEKD